MASTRLIPLFSRSFLVSLLLTTKVEARLGESGGLAWLIPGRRRKVITSKGCSGLQGNQQRREERLSYLNTRWAGMSSSPYRGATEREGVRPLEERQNNCRRLWRQAVMRLLIRERSVCWDNGLVC